MTVAVRKKSERHKIASSLKMDWPLYLMMVPGIAFFILFCYVPMYGVVIAFSDYDIYKGFADMPWVGLRYFDSLFSNVLFMRTLKNTIIISVSKMVCGFPVPLLFAILLNEVRHMRYKKLVQTVVCLPNFISWVVIYGILYALLSPNNGAIKTLMRTFGYTGVIPNLMTDKSLFRGLLVGSDIWKSFGFGSILYIATISSIDTQLYEAAQIDGAGKIRQTWHITLPGLRSVIVLRLILGMGSILNAGFDQIYIMYNANVQPVAEIIDTYVYKIGLLDNNFTMSTAAGLFKSVIGMALVLITNWLAKKIDEDSGLI